MRVFDRLTIESSLPLSTCIDLMEDAFSEVQREKIAIQGKNSLGFMGTMMAYEKEGTLGIAKLVSLFSGRPHEGAIAVFDTKQSALIALMEAGSITALRTAATSALATKYLTKDSAKSLAIVGAGEEALYHALAISKIRNLEKIKIFNRTLKRAERLKEELLIRLNHISIEVYELYEVETKLKDIDILCMTTASDRPLVKLSDLPGKIHINSIGACTPNLRELADDIIEKARVFVDDIFISGVEAGHLVNHSNKERFHLAEAFQKDFCFEGITLFNSSGVALQDLACAKYLCRSYL